MLQINKEVNNNVIVYHFIGSFETSDTLYIQEIFSNDLMHCGKFIFHFSDMAFMSKTAANALISCVKKAIEYYADIFLADVKGQPKMMLELTNSSKFFKTYPDVKHAIKQYKRINHGITY